MLEIDKAHVWTLLRQIHESALNMYETEDQEADMETINDNLDEIKAILKEAK